MSSNADEEENHSGKDQGSVEDVNTSSALHWTEAAAGPTHTLSSGSELPDYFSLSQSCHYRKTEVTAMQNSVPGQSIIKIYIQSLIGCYASLVIYH